MDLLLQWGEPRLKRLLGVGGRGNQGMGRAPHLGRQLERRQRGLVETSCFPRLLGPWASSSSPFPSIN